MNKKFVLFCIILLCISLVTGCNEDDAKIETELVFQKGFSTQIELFEGEEMNDSYIMYKGIVDFKNNNVVFFSSDENVVRVEVSSQEFPIYTYFDIIAVSEGEAVIYAQNVDGSVISEPVKITVIKNADISDAPNVLDSETNQTPAQTVDSETEVTESQEESEPVQTTESQIPSHNEPVDTIESQTPSHNEPVAETETKISGDTEPKSEEIAATYILNTNSKKFHLPSCTFVTRMKEENRAQTQSTRDELISQGYEACKTCKP